MKGSYLLESPQFAGVQETLRKERLNEILGRLEAMPFEAIAQYAKTLRGMSRLYNGMIGDEEPSLDAAVRAFESKDLNLKGVREAVDTIAMVEFGRTYCGDSRVVNDTGRVREAYAEQR